MSGGQSLHIAASGGDVARVRSILTTPRSFTAGFPALLSRATRSSPSATASNNNNGGTVTTTVDVNELDAAGYTALQRAAAEGHEEIIRLLLAHGADVNRKDSVHGNTALHEAAWKGYSRTVGLLATAGAHLGVPNNGGFAPLHLCCQNGHNQSCRELLLAGCDPDLQNNYGDTPLHTAARYGHAGVTRILISAQCRVSEQNKNGDTALHIAAAMGRRKLTRILLEAGCDKHLRNKQSETAKDIATRKDLNEIIHIINTTKPLKRKGSDKGEKKRGKNEHYSSKDNNNSSRHKKKSKVRFDASRHWSPYGCHYFPDPKSFPKPKLDSLPDEPLRKGEQYYLDLAGNICKGPIGVGYTCYCAPFFKHMEERLDRDKQELKAHIDKAHERLDHKVTSLELKTQGQISELTRCVAAERALCDKRHQHLEQWLLRSRFGRQSERVRKVEHSPYGSQDILTRSRSLELLDDINGEYLDTEPTNRMNSRSMELLDDHENDHEPVTDHYQASGPNGQLYSSKIVPEHFQFKSQVMKETAAMKNMTRHKQLMVVDHHGQSVKPDEPRKSVSEMVAQLQQQHETQMRKMIALRTNESNSHHETSPPKDNSIYNSSLINNRTELHIPILHQTTTANEHNNHENSESSDDDEHHDYDNNPYRRRPVDVTGNFASNYENITRNCYNNTNEMNGSAPMAPSGATSYGAPRTRSVLYSPTDACEPLVPDMLLTADIHNPHIHVQHPFPEDHLKNTGLYVLDTTAEMSTTIKPNYPNTQHTVLQMNQILPETVTDYVPYRQLKLDRNRKPIDLHLLEKDVHTRIANLQLLDRDIKKDINMIEHNDSGYSTKVYGSSQGNSPSLSGEVENINHGKNLPSPSTTSSTSQNPRPTDNNIGASSLV